MSTNISPSKQSPLEKKEQTHVSGNNNKENVLKNDEKIKFPEPKKKEKEELKKNNEDDRSESYVPSDENDVSITEDGH